MLFLETVRWGTMIYIAPLTRENSLNYSQLPFQSRLHDIYPPVSSKTVDETNKLRNRCA